jgi:hypothetical protein
VIEVSNAIITSVGMGNGDHGVLSAWLHLDYGDAGQGFGGYVLYAPHSASNKDYTGLWIWRCLEVAGVDDWDSLKGRPIRARHEPSRVHAIGHILKDIWFEPAIAFKGSPL